MCVQIGDVVQFQRKKLTFKGTVLKLYQFSVLVEIIEVTGGSFDFDKTVVSHNNYEIIGE